MQGSELWLPAFSPDEPPWYVLFSIILRIVIAMALVLDPCLLAERSLTDAN